MLVVAVASVSTVWKSKARKKDGGPACKLELDSGNGCTVTHDCECLVIDKWRLVPSASGQGYEEVLQGRAYATERRRNGGNPVGFDPRPKPPAQSQPGS